MRFERKNLRSSFDEINAVSKKKNVSKIIAFKTSLKTSKYNLLDNKNCIMSINKSTNGIKKVLKNPLDNRKRLFLNLKKE